MANDVISLSSGTGGDDRSSKSGSGSENENEGDCASESGLVPFDKGAVVISSFSLNEDNDNDNDNPGSPIVSKENAKAKGKDKETENGADKETEGKEETEVETEAEGQREGEPQQKKHESKSQNDGSDGGEPSTEEKSNILGDEININELTIENLPKFVQGCFDKNVQIQVRCCTAIRQLLSMPILKNGPIDAIIESGVVPRLIEFLSINLNDANSSNVELKKMCCKLQFESSWCLTNICSSNNNSHTNHVVECGAIVAFINLLSSSNIDIVDQAVWALGNIAINSNECRDKVLLGGGLKNLVILFYKCFSFLQIIANGNINSKNSSKQYESKENDSNVIHKSVAETALQCSREYIQQAIKTDETKSTDNDLGKDVAARMAQMSKLDKLIAASRMREKHRVHAKKLLNVDLTEIVEVDINDGGGTKINKTKIGKLNSEQIKDMQNGILLLDPVRVEPLMPLLKICSSFDNNTQTITMDGSKLNDKQKIEMYVKVVQGVKEMHGQNSAGVEEKKGKESENTKSQQQSQVQPSGEPILHGLRQCKKNPCLNYSFKIKTKSCAILLRKIAWTLCNLCRSKPRLNVSIIQMVVNFLSYLICINDEQVLEKVCWILSYLIDPDDGKIDIKNTQNLNKNVNAPCNNDSALRLIKNAGLIDKLIKLQCINGDYKNIGISHATIRIFASIASQDDRKTQYIVNLGILSQINDLLQKHVQTKSKNVTVIKEACWLVSNITAGTKEQISSVFDANLIPILVNLLKNNVFVVKKEALYAIGNAIAGGTIEQIRYLINQGIIESICQLLDVSSCGNIIVMFALGILNDILKCGEKIKLQLNEDENRYMMMIEEIGGLDKLECIQCEEKTDDHVYEKAQQIIKTYWPCDDD